MKQFAYSSFRLRDASFEIRLVYTLFLIFILLGLVTNWLIQFGRIGFTNERIVAYYLGGQIQGQLFFPKNLNALLEETHFHAFMMGVIFLILGHLFLATSLRTGTKRFIILLGFFANFFDIGSVWLIRTQSPMFAYLLMLSWISLAISYLGMIFIPLAEMWYPLGLNAK